MSFGSLFNSQELPGYSKIEAAGGCHYYAKALIEAIAPYTLSDIEAMEEIGSVDHRRNCVECNVDIEIFAALVSRHFYCSG